MSVIVTDATTHDSAPQPWTATSLPTVVVELGPIGIVDDANIASGVDAESQLIGFRQGAFRCVGFVFDLAATTDSASSVAVVDNGIQPVRYLSISDIADLGTSSAALPGNR